MKGLARHIPNTLTCLSLAFGFYAAILGISGHYFGAMVAILIAAVFDFSDGLAARLLKAYSAMGKELDSLADTVSFGVAPGMMLFSFLDKLLYSLSWNDSIACKSLLFAAFAIPVLSAIRLAKFNIDERQKTSFIGLPVPAHAILWSSLITVLASDIHASLCIFPQLAGLLASIQPSIMLIALSISALASSLLLVSEIPMFSLKATSFSLKTNKLPYTLIASAILLVLLFGIAGIPATILLYILLSLTFKRK
jgi:CDP-diacylglycerol--serine O-phosphatidyltransferase